MNGFLCCFLGIAVLSVAGCSRNVGPATDTESETLVPFMASGTNGGAGVTGRWGFRDVGGKIVVPARYLDVDPFFCEGFAWVDTDGCEHGFQGHVPEHWLDRPNRGTFVNSAGRPLPLSHAHSVHVTWDGDPVWKPPRFDHGLAFVRLEDGSICGLTTNGTSLDVHGECGMFADSSANPEIEDDWYWHYRGDWAIVGLSDGRLGILDGARRFVVGPTNDAAFVKREWQSGVFKLDPVEFPDAGFCRWLDAEIEMEGPMLLPLGKLCLFLDLALNKAEPEFRLDVDCRGYDSRSGILIKESPKTIRHLLEQVRCDHHVFPMVSRAGIFFVGLDERKENAKGNIIP